MGMEIEAKYKVASHDPIVSRLESLGAEPGRREIETSTILDTPERKLLDSDCGLRVRTSCLYSPETTAEEPAWGTLTFKGPRRPSDHKQREEIETGSDDPARLTAILERLGFRPVIVYEKVRQAWTLDRCVVTLDTLPRLGTWVEIEGMDTAGIDRVAMKLGLDPASSVRQTYVELAAQHGEKDEQGVYRLEFEQLP